MIHNVHTICSRTYNNKTSVNGFSGDPRLEIISVKESLVQFNLRSLCVYCGLTSVQFVKRPPPYVAHRNSGQSEHVIVDWWLAENCCG
jgi:hypothetical protein